MSLYTRARKHIDMDRVKEIHEEKIKERINKIALQEKEYLLYFTQNTVPKYYDWRTGKFNENSLEEINKLVCNRLEKLDDALSEGMTSKDFKYLYGGVITYDILSINPTAVSSTFAQDCINASSEVTSHMFGPNFPGSHINSIGDFSPQSYSKVDVLATASWNSIQDVTPSGWTPENSYEYVDSVSDVVTPGQESDVFKDTLFGEVTVTGTDFSLSTGDDEDPSQENTVDIADLETLFPGVTFPTGHPIPGETDREPPYEASMLLRTFKSIKVGQEITFNYSFTSLETEEDGAGLPINPIYRGETRDVAGDDSNMDDYAFVLIAGRVQKIVSVMARDGNNIDFNFQPNADDYYKPDVLQSRFPLTGRYRYTVKSDDIDDYGNLKLFVGVMDAGDGSYESNLDVTNFKLDSSRLAAGQLGKTTDAYNLGTSVASLNPNKKKGEKKDREKNTFAKKYGLPDDYLDRLSKAAAYFTNNVGNIYVPMGLGTGTMGVKEKVDELMIKAFEKQGFTKKQIETIQKNKLLKITSKRVKSDYDRTVERWEKEREEREKITRQAMDRRPRIGVQPGGGGTRDIGMPKQKTRIGVQPGGGGTRDITSTNQKSRFGVQPGGGGTRDIGMPDQKGGRSINPNLIGRGLRSATDQIRYGGKMMFQGNPAGRAPGLSNYWSPDPKTAATYTNPGKGKGIPGRGPNPTGTLTTARRPPGTPRVTRGITGTPQFKFPQGSPPPSKMITQMADDAAVSIAKKTAATKASKFLGRAVPVAGAAIAVADAGMRASKGDYAGAVLSGLSAVPGPAGWAALAVQIATDAAGFTGGVKEQQEFDNYGDYIKGAAKIAKKDKIKIDRNAMLDLFLRELSKDNKLSNKDKEFLVAIFTDAEGLEKDDVITFVKKIQKKLMDGKSIEEQLYPGQPSPNGFPDTPPLQLAPNGYHQEFGKRSNRYRRLDPISAKTMDKVGTDDPETNKQVAAAAADSEPKKLPSGAVKKYARRNVVKKESNNLYTRSTKYIDMKRVKEMREEKIKEQRASKIVERQLENVAELKEIEKSVDWRSDLNEMMTTAWPRIPKD